MVEDELSVLMVPLPGSYRNELVDALEARGVEVRTSSGLFRIVGGIRRDGVPDVLHLHFMHRHIVHENPLVALLFGVRFLLELLVARAAGVTVVWTVHNLTGHESPVPRAEIVVRHLVCWLCDSIIVHCDTAADLVTARYRLPSHVASRLTTVPHGNYLPRYPDDVTRAEARADLDLASDDRVFLFFGHIRPYKNVDELIQVFRRLDLDGATLLVAGNPLDDDIERTITELCADEPRIRATLEFIPDEDVQYYFRAADVVVLPFEDSLTSGSVILGMTFARPVVAPTVGCVRELLDSRGGFPYDPDDPDGLVRALERAATADLTGMGETNFERVRPLDWDVIAGRTIDVYLGRDAVERRTVTNPVTG